MDNCLSSSCVMMVFVMEFLRSNMSRSHVVFLSFFCVLGFWSSAGDYYILLYNIYIGSSLNSPVYNIVPLKKKKRKKRLDFHPPGQFFNKQKHCGE